MKMEDRSLGGSLKAREYDWIDSYIGCRPPAGSESEYPESVDVLMESDLLRTVVFTILLGGLASLIANETKVIDIIAPWLTLEGLKIVYELNNP